MHHAGDARPPLHTDSRPQPPEALPQQASPSRWCYELVPVSPLPALDLSKSLKSQLLSELAARRVDAFLRRNSKPLFLSYLVSLALSISVPLLSADAGRAAALGCLVFGLPLGLGSFASLRYDLVRLLWTKYDFWFYLCANGVTYVGITVMFRDLRIARALIDFLGFQNIVLIDAQLLGIRQLVKASVVAILTINVLLVCIMLDRVDQVHNFSIFRYQSQSRRYNMTSVDVVANGLVTMTILILKIVYRKRRSFQRATTASRRGLHVIECAIYRVSVQLAPVTAPVARTHDAAVDASRSQSSAVKAPQLEQMRYVSTGMSFDASETVLPLQIRSDARFPLVLLLVLYASGIGGVAFVSLTVVLVIWDSERTSISEQQQQQLANPIHLHCAVLALALTAFFTMSCTALHQRQLLKSLLKSFDFAFNALQLTSMHICICVLYDNWAVAPCVVGASLLWTYWILTLDALTPLMKAKLGFHVRFAIPVIVVGVLWHSTLLYHILSDSGPLDRIIWEGKLLTHHLQIRVIPFYISRFVTLVPWFLRILWRLVKASNVEAITLRASVVYRHHRHSHGAHKHSSRVSATAAGMSGAPSNRIAPASGPTRDDELSLVPASVLVASLAKEEPG